jgi:hypothetical protein
MDMVGRMAEGLLPLFSKHRVPLAGYWVARSGSRIPRFYYLMNWADDAERRRCWGTFYEDPEWAALRERTNAGSELVERGTFVFLDNVGAASAGAERCTRSAYRLSTLTVAAGAAPRARQAVVDIVEPMMRAVGGEPLALWNVLSGPGLPALMHLSAWDSAGTALELESRLEKAEDLRSWIGGDRAAHGSAALAAWDVCLLEAPAGGRPNMDLSSIVGFAATQR